MKLITVIIIGVFTVTSAIRVPPSWPKKQNLQHVHKFRTTVRPSVGSEIGYRTRPHVIQIQHNKINSRQKYQPRIQRHPNLKRSGPKTEFKASATTNDWTPVFPAYMFQQDLKNFKEPFIRKNEYKKKSPLYKNYRDDKTHEPSYDTETVKERHIHKETPKNEYEAVPDVPTRPIYPGEGQWAKKGIKHRPFISNHKFKKLEDDSEDVRPDGYEIFEQNKKLFDRQKEQFRDNIDQFPQKHKLGEYRRPKQEVEEEEEEEDTEGDDEEEQEQGFVPIKLYTQVRRSESEEHLPRLVEDPRLREVIKDSKIQTVYTEEGYEDIAYDHAGHEKTAEQDEGFAEFDKEIEKEKQRRKKKEEEEKSEDDSQTAGSQHKTVNKPIKIKKDNFLKTEEIQTASLKDQDGDKTELEILSEIKVLASPENGTTTHKYVKIVPKMYKYDKINDTTQIPEMMSMESVMRKHFRRRFKRYANEYPKIEIDTDFIDKIKHDIPKSPKIKEKPKYPYYNDKRINPYSPLRYAEDLDNIPKKTEDDFAFYNQADKIECEEVQSNVDPIPARVKNVSDDPENAEEASDVQALPQTPRLRNLGDKIDCFKVKYFGENPLDSPFFKEKDIGPVIPLFNVFSKATSIDVKPNEIPFEEKRSYSSKISVRKELKQKDDNHLGVNILSDVIGQFQKPKVEVTTEVQKVLKLEIVTPKPDIVENQTEAATISIITTPKYTIDLKPKHIYHQIELLDHLPYQEKMDTDVTSTVFPPNHRQSKSIEEVTGITDTTINTSEETAPESQALRNRRRRLKAKPPSLQRRKRPYHHIFDINKYIPTHSYNYLNRIIRTSTSVPKQNVKSEVHYKHEIKPDEQLNVFADVINNIKNSSKDPQQIAASSSSRIGVKLNVVENYQKVPLPENDDLDNVDDKNGFYLSSTTVAPRGKIRYSSYKHKDELTNRERGQYENLELLKVNRKLTTSTTSEPYSGNTRIATEEEEEEEELEDTTEKVVGLMPPDPSRYKTIFTPRIVEEIKMNNFYVVGMKPPSFKQKVYLYSDFKTRRSHSKRKHSYLRRGKRSAQRPSYSEVVRNRNKPIDLEDDTEVKVEEDDDYVPHRPKNYHYDEKTGRIVYDKVETEAPEEEYIEVTEAPLPKPTRRNSITTPKFEEYTGPSYVDFVKKLKSDPKYQEITDPPTTEKEAEDVTTTTTTRKPISTDPPEFLSILAKVRTDSTYKTIEDEKKVKAKTMTTTETPEEEEQESQVENVQNSPGGQLGGSNFQIFDITEYLPKVKTYSPRTSIDYSKYKTIERSNPSTRHNMSSRYNSDQLLENVKHTSEVPIMEDRNSDEGTEINPVMSESKHEDVEPSTTTTEVPSSTTTTRRVRTRTKTRGSRRPTQRATTQATVRSTARSTVTESPQVQHDKPRRTFPRRQRTRIRVTKPTTELPETETQETVNVKVVRRRHQSEPIDRIDSSRVVGYEKKSNQTKEPRKIDSVEVVQKYDETKKHGGNYRKETEESESKKTHNVRRLTDIVQKPAAFYTDPKLPKKVNQLMEVKIDDTEIVEEGEENKNEDDVAVDYDYEGSEEKTTTTKKPFFVKDPSKRLYYYAPI
ncbi:titin-like [Tribolium madens]|uniref:titin-like n=1 Tax=Tribolium madens TaxID=41895 RepID=UPI001CF7240C|nr:titin-like [Tribolium madens]